MLHRPAMDTATGIFFLYNVNHKKTCHFVFDYNSGFSWSISFILFAPVKTIELDVYNKNIAQKRIETVSLIQISNLTYST